jgi:hypothetical protein
MTSEHKIERGTYCVVIESQLITASCPLKKGTCMWKHRIHGGCTYDEEFANPAPDSHGNTKYPDPNEYALRVGLPPISPELVNILRNALVTRVKEEVST